MELLNTIVFTLLSLVLLVQVAYLIYVIKCKRTINSLPEDSDEEYKIEDRLSKIKQRIDVFIILTMIFLVIKILFFH